MAAIVEEVEVAAEAATLWRTFGGFGSVGDWHPMLERVDSEGEEPGQRRVAIGGDGSRQIERLVAVDPIQHAYSYDIEESAMSVENYHALFRIEPSGEGGSRVTWSAEFDTTAEPEATEATVREFIRAGLDALKARAEGEEGTAEA